MSCCGGNCGCGSGCSLDEIKKPDPIAIPDDFRCPISWDLMRDPVIVATGQTYERSFIQKWIDYGNATCPTTQQKLENFTLIPNYALRSLITQWCAKHNIEQPTALTNGKMKKSDGSFRDVSGDIAANIQALVRKLSSGSVEERRTAAAKIRSLSKRSTDNRILIAESGGIPILVNLLTSEDEVTQENAVTSILNFFIYENMGLKMLAGAIPSIVKVLRNGSMKARENAAATLRSLSRGFENRITIGESGAIPALVALLQDRSTTTRVKKGAATALSKLCIYQGNKDKAVRAGIIPTLSKMLTDPSNCMVDEALTLKSVLDKSGTQRAKRFIN